MQPMKNAKSIKSLIKSFIMPAIYKFIHAKIMQNQLVATICLEIPVNLESQGSYIGKATIKDHLKKYVIVG